MEILAVYFKEALEKYLTNSFIRVCRGNHRPKLHLTSSDFFTGSYTWNFQGYWRKSMWKFRRSIKKKKGFPGVFKKNSCGVSMVSMVFDYGSSKGCHTILQNFQGFKLVFSGISKDKVTNLKFQQWFSKIVPGLTKKLHAFPQLEILHLWCYVMLTGRKPCVYGYVLNFLAIYITGFFMRF